MSRIYVCHTFYHVYIAFLKEFKARAEQGGTADLVLSTLSNDFGDLKARIDQTGFFDEVVMFDEKRDDFFPELAGYRQDTGNLARNLFQRIRFTSRYARLEAPYVPVDFRKYGDIYVFCDSDPIGIYLSKNRIRYHAVEDGLNCIKNFDTARFDNRGHFGVKRFLSERLNLIFIQNGYGKYCIDMEVNDSSLLDYPLKKYRDEPRKELAARLTAGEKELLLAAFVRDRETLQERIGEAAERGDGILILTEPLCTLDVRERIFRDLVAEYGKEGTVFLKPHPRDELDYRTLFADIPQFDAALPMELLNFFPGLHFCKSIGVLTEIGGISFADERVRLGPDFLDRYEAPEIHRQNERIGLGGNRTERIVRPPID